MPLNVQIVLRELNLQPRLESRISIASSYLAGREMSAREISWVALNFTGMSKPVQVMLIVELIECLGSTAKTVQTNANIHVLRIMSCKCI
jgi:hypothetical protein